MGVLTSKELSSDRRLQDCSVSNSAHVVPGESGPHVRKIQDALINVGGQSIDDKELIAGSYGASTASAVEAFKRAQVPPLLNYRHEIDPITGIGTITKLDKLLKTTPPHRHLFRLALRPSRSPAWPASSSVSLERVRAVRSSPATTPFVAGKPSGLLRS